MLLPKENFNKIFIVKFSHSFPRHYRFYVLNVNRLIYNTSKEEFWLAYYINLSTFAFRTVAHLFFPVYM